MRARSPARRLVSRLFWPLAAALCQAIGVASRAVWFAFTR